MSPEPKIAAETTIVDLGNGAGVLVAAGDPIPVGAAARPYRENQPNKVDAATNADVADAADQASSSRPAGPTVVQTVGMGSPGDGEPAGDHGSEAPAKGANRDEWDAYAAKLGITPSDYAKKDELIAAVEKAQA